MKKILLVLVSLFAFSLNLAAAPLTGNDAAVILQDLPLWQDQNGALTWVENLTIGDKVTLLNKAGKFKQSGKEYDFIRVKAPDGKEGWARTPYVVSKATLAVVKTDKAIIYSEPRDVKVTSRYISNMTIVAVLQDGTTTAFAKVQCYDAKQNVLSTDATFVTTDNLTFADFDLNTAILYTVAAATKNADVKKNLLTVAMTKYPGSVFLAKVQQALGISPVVAKDTMMAVGSYTVDFDNVNVRDAPDEVNGKVLTQLDQGTVVEVTEETTQSYTVAGKTAAWFKIADPEGWVFGASLSPQE